VRLEAEILRKYRTVAVVGASRNPARAGHYVPKYLKEHGYRIIPVTRDASEVLEEKAYPDLRSVPEPVEVVVMFRRPAEAPPVVEDAIAIGAKAVWMQSGIVNDEAAARAREAGLEVVMDRCMKTEHRRGRK
jgi:predicted CoA-binding protein